MTQEHPVEHLVQAKKAHVTAWIRAISLQNKESEQNPGITDLYKAKYTDGYNSISLYHNRAGSEPQDMCIIELIPLTDDRTLLRVSNLKGDWAMLEPAWARLLAEIEEYLQYGPSQKASSRKPGRKTDPDIDEAYKRIEIDGEDRQAVLDEITKRNSQSTWKEEDFQTEKDRILSGIRYRKKTRK